MQSHGMNIDTRVLIADANINSDISYIRTAGYSTVGDGGEALYKRVSSEPGHPGKVQSADGAWWEITEASLRFEMFGSDGSDFDDAIAVAQARGYARDTGPEAIYLLDGAYAPTSGFNAADSLIYKAPGTSLYGNTAHGWVQTITTLPPTFNDFQLDPIHVVRYFDAQVKDRVDPTKTNGVLKAGAPITAAAVFGLNSPAIGTPLALRSTMEVHEVGDPDIGYNEIGGIYNHIVVHGDKVQPSAKYSIWAHDTIAMTGRERPKWFGASFRFHNMANASPSGGDDGSGNSWEGLTGISIMQRPLFPEDATYTGYSPTDPVYPMAAGLTISGYGGPASATDGTHPDALHGFYNGLQIGGNNSPYLAHNARSKLLNGIQIQDYTLQGLIISNPHPSFNASAGSGAAITIGADAGSVVLGVAAPTQNVTIHVRHATNGGIKLYRAENQAVNRQALINFDNSVLLGMDLSGSNDDVFGMYHNGAGKYGFTVGPNGHFALSNAPTSPTGLQAGTLWNDAGTVKIA